ncbi:hypothetical protein SAMN06265182_1251 [Persephonella hydrogeniphila]|uniref:Uncharacterized protein n=1 Tax=Persephonella hydrogeniphila TaxID=198703 RepID=A0A285NFK1_9AQUI|nr:hypothetical protein [Persephonella hydrogeniphila]SNZ08284.1 hypothetical protein SAMN06265182_1251 [Persephonella hydrogeniphila]
MYLLVVDNGVIISIDQVLKWNSFFSNFKTICGVNFERLKLAKREYENKKNINIGGIEYVDLPSDPDFNRIYNLLVSYRNNCNSKDQRVKCIGEIDLKQMAYVLYLIEKNIKQKGFPKYLTEENVLRKFVRETSDLKPYFKQIFCSTKDILFCYCTKYKALKYPYKTYIQKLKEKGRNLDHLPDPKVCFCCKQDKN